MIKLKKQGQDFHSQYAYVRIFRIFLWMIDWLAECAPHQLDLLQNVCHDNCIATSVYCNFDIVNLTVLVIAQPISVIDFICNTQLHRLYMQVSFYPFHSQFSSVNMRKQCFLSSIIFPFNIPLLRHDSFCSSEGCQRVYGPAKNGRGTVEEPVLSLW